MGVCVVHVRIKCVWRMPCDFLQAVTTCLCVVFQSFQPTDLPEYLLSPSLKKAGTILTILRLICLIFLLDLLCRMSQGTKRQKTNCQYQYETFSVPLNIYELKSYKEHKECIQLESQKKPLFVDLAHNSPFIHC